MAKLIFSKKRKKLNLCLPFLYHSRKCWVNFARIGDVESAPQLLFFAYELHQTTLVMAFNSNISPNSFHCNLLVIATSPRSEESKRMHLKKIHCYTNNILYIK